LVRAAHQLEPEPVARRIRDLWICGLARPEDGSPADLSSSAMIAYTTPEKTRFQAGAPLVKAALQILLDRWPGALPFETLFREARQLLGGGDEANDDVLTKSILEGFRNEFLYLTIGPGRYSTELTDRPVGNPLARLQVAAEEPWVTNGMHSEIKLSAFSRRLLVHLDGRDRSALIEALEKDLAAERLVLRTKEGEPVEEPELVRRALEAALEHHLGSLAHFALLAS
jgi:hypothetical protein